MGKFKDLITGKERLDEDKEKLEEAVGGVVSTPAINSGSAVANGRQGNATRSGDSRIDTGGKFTFDSSQLPGKESRSVSSEPNPKQAFKEETESDALVLHEDDGGSVMVREQGENYDMVIRAGSQEKVFQLDEDAAERAVKFFT
jgi:hypothetical protein